MCLSGATLNPAHGQVVTQSDHLAFAVTHAATRAFGLVDLGPVKPDANHDQSAIAVGATPLGRNRAPRRM